MPETNKIICGAMPEATKVFPDGYFNCSISSPPYWGLRDYGWDVCMLFGSIDDFCMPRSAKKRKRWWIMIRWRASLRGGVFSPNKKTWIGALGLEPTFELYIEHLCTIYDEVKRVLRDDGTCWVNLGDTYGGSWGNYGAREGKQRQQNVEKFDRPGATPQNFRPGSSGPGIPSKSLCLIPQRFAIEMVNRGWILRNVLIWHKPNPMPSSAKDRFTVDFEYVYFFVKSKKYWFEPQYEPYLYDGRHDTILKPTDKYPGGRSPMKMEREPMERWPNPLGRNKRCVWTIPTQPYPEAHFATFPEKLVEPMIKAGCPEFVCTKCGKAIYTKRHTEEFFTTPNSRKIRNVRPDAYKRPPSNWKAIKTKKEVIKCNCNAEWRPGRTLDCFLWIWDYFTGGRKAA